MWIVFKPTSTYTHPLTMLANYGGLDLQDTKKSSEVLVCAPKGLFAVDKLARPEAKLRVGLLHRRDFFINLQGLKPSWVLVFCREGNFFF